MGVGSLCFHMVELEMILGVAVAVAVAVAVGLGAGVEMLRPALSLISRSQQQLALAQRSTIAL